MQQAPCYYESICKAKCGSGFFRGVDSSLLLKMAAIYAKEQGKTVYGITAHTELHPVGDVKIAEKVVKEAGAEHILLKLEELKQADILQNPVDRCYRCKKYLFSKIKEKAEQSGAAILLEGTNAEDLLAYRPGIRAIEELGIKSPLKEAGFTKAEVRKLAFGTKYPWLTDRQRHVLQPVSLMERH